MWGGGGLLEVLRDSEGNGINRGQEPDSFLSTHQVLDDSESIQGEGGLVR